MYSPKLALSSSEQAFNADLTDQCSQGHASVREGSPANQGTATAVGGSPSRSYGQANRKRPRSDGEKTEATALAEVDAAVNVSHGKGAPVVAGVSPALQTSLFRDYGVTFFACVSRSFHMVREPSGPNTFLIWKFAADFSCKLQSKCLDLHAPPQDLPDATQSL